MDTGGNLHRIMAGTECPPIPVKHEELKMPNWSIEAQRAVAHVESELSEAHRGAFLWYEPQGVVLVFSNGLEEDPIPEKQVDSSVRPGAIGILGAKKERQHD